MQHTMKTKIFSVNIIINLINLLNKHGDRWGGDVYKFKNSNKVPLTQTSVTCIKFCNKKRIIFLLYNAFIFVYCRLVALVVMIWNLWSSLFITISIVIKRLNILLIMYFRFHFIPSHSQPLNIPKRNVLVDLYNH